MADVKSHIHESRPMHTASLYCLCLAFLMTTASNSSAQKIPLDGDWLFHADSGKVGVSQQWYAPAHNRQGWSTVPIPKFWESYPGLARYDGWGWFVKSVSVENPAVPLSVYFAGVDDDATVWVNGVEVGSHTGYSDPFAVDLRGALTSGKNLICVLVKDYSGGGGIYRPVTLIETAHLDDLLKGPYFGKPALRSAEWVQKGAIYSVYLRSFSQEGTFAGLERRVPQLKQLGVNILWLLPIHPIGEKRRKGNLGSPYAVRDFYGINPEFGTMDDFKRLLTTVHNNGMKLIIDLVANHTSWDSKLLVEHPEWFTKNVKGEIVPPNEDWTDVADLDYAHRELRTYMITMMGWWVRDVGIDGFRCDVAELVPTDFWEEARAALQRIKPIVMLSEGSLPEHHLKAFDLTYSWNIYDALEPLVTGKRAVELIDQILRNEELQFPVGALRMRFTTNHDKNAWEAPAVERLGLPGLKLATVLINTLPGVPMIYNGEEVANDRKLDLFEKVIVDWTRSDDVGKLYQRLFHLRAKHRALSQGEFVRVRIPDQAGVYGFLRVSGKDRIFVVLNFSPRDVSFQALLPREKVLVNGAGAVMKDALGGGRLQLTADKPDVKLMLEPWGYRAYVLE